MIICRANLACLWFAALLAADTAHGSGNALEVRVLDRDDQPVADVAVYAMPLDHEAAAPAAPAAMIEQTDNAFVPHVLVIQAGTEVMFPNNDDVSHHVYSFSDTKTFELGLYKGNAHPPIRFDRPGVVVLGCNIHDGMLGYILVVDTRHFARTDANGRATLASLPSGRYSVEVWTPRGRQDALPRPATVTVSADRFERIVFRFADKLKPPHAHGGASLTWDRY